RHTRRRQPHRHQAGGEPAQVPLSEAGAQARTLRRLGEVEDAARVVYGISQDVNLRSASRGRSSPTPVSAPTRQGRSPGNRGERSGPAAGSPHRERPPAPPAPPARHPPTGQAAPPPEPDRADRVPSRAVGNQGPAWGRRHLRRPERRPGPSEGGKPSSCRARPVRRTSRTSAYSARGHPSEPSR